MKSAPVTGHSYPRTVFIGSEPLLTAWSARAGETTEVIPVALTDLAAAIDTIGAAQPEVVVIEQAVAASVPGATLMDRLHNERYLRGIEVRLLPPDRAADVISSGPGDLHPQTWLNVLAHALPPRPERRAARIRVTPDEQAFIDGQPVTLIDLSAVGAQVRSHAVLKPRQRIRLVLPPERGSVKAVAVVAWSTFEIGPTPTYRAGVAFTRAIPDPA
ncbi:MAG TPA: PilZ domain-containing protein [Vicinamibacterales bacterium]|nr:PilZ domain-containing protein [Vicinamibacterales bacterium]